MATGADVSALLIAGPTASGKSALALDLAARLNGVVINADSMQVYRDLNVLSARPTAEEIARIEHRLYGHVPSETAYTVGLFIKDAAQVLAQVRAAERMAIIVGGTGLYFRALTEGLVETPPIPPSVQAEVAALCARGETAYQRLAEVDAETAARLSPRDLPRIQRALEVHCATGRSLSDWRRSEASPLLPAGSWRGLFLAPERETLYRRIELRFGAMLDQGAMDEARALLACDLPPNVGVMKAHGLKHLIACLNGQITLDVACELGQRDTRNYAKRQFTWARRFMADWMWRRPEEMTGAGQALDHFLRGS